MKTALKILIVEDCIVMQSVIKKTLLMSGLPVELIEVAENGLEGLQKLKNRSFNLMLIDINMPEMNGIEMIEKLKEIPKLKQIPILIVSADTQKQKIKLIEKKGDNSINKPFTPEELKKKVIHVVNSVNKN